MSAIWGQVAFKENIDFDNSNKMLEVYEQKCKIDRFELVNTDIYYMFCGKVFVREEDNYKESGLSAGIDKKKYGIVSDCIIDNRDELSNILYGKSDNLLNLSDEDIISLMYIRFGKKFVNYLRGLYAIAIFNTTDNCLELYTDPVSARSIYYYIDNENKIVTFSTLIEPIRCLYPSISADICYIKDYLVAPGLKPNLEAGRSSFEGIKQVLAGSIVKINLKDCQLVGSSEKYFNWIPLENADYRNSKSVARQFRKIYEECISDAIRTSGEVAVSMSSGLDSASIGALAAKALNEHNKKLFTYTYVPEQAVEKTRIGNVIFDETNDVKKILAMYPNMIPNFLNNNGRNCYEFLEQDINVMEMPIKAYVNFPNLFEIYNRAREDGCKIILTGQTGNGSVSFGYIDDVLFQLYESHKYFTMCKYLNRYSKTVRESRKKAFKACFGLYRNSVDRKKNDRDEIIHYRASNEFLSDKILTDYDLVNRFYEADMKFFGYMPTDRADYRSYYYNDALYAYIGAMETKMGLYSGVLIRDVTKDVRMLRFCYYLPFKYFAYKGVPRWLIRENLRDILPNDLLDDWMRYGLQNKDCFDRIARDWDYVSQKAISIIDNVRTNKKCMDHIDQLVDIEALAHFYTSDIQENQEWEAQFDYATFALIVLLFYQNC